MSTSDSSTHDYTSLSLPTICKWILETLMCMKRNSRKFDNRITKIFHGSYQYFVQNEIESIILRSWEPSAWKQIVGQGYYTSWYGGILSSTKIYYRSSPLNLPTELSNIMLFPCEFWIISRIVFHNIDFLVSHFNVAIYISNFLWVCNRSNFEYSLLRIKIVKEILKHPQTTFLVY